MVSKTGLLIQTKTPTPNDFYITQQKKDEKYIPLILEIQSFEHFSQSLLAGSPFSEAKYPTDCQFLCYLSFHAVSD